MTDDPTPVPAVSDIETADEARTAWRALLYERFANQPVPVVLFSDSVRSAASLWAGMRAWVSTFRAVKIGAGDRVVSELPAGEALLQLTLACLWESVGLVLVDTAADAPRTAGGVNMLLARYDARSLVGSRVSGAPVLEPMVGGWPLTPGDGWTVRATADRPDPSSDLADINLALPKHAATCLEAARASGTRGLFAGTRLITLCDWQIRGGLWGGVLLPLLEVEELFVPADYTDAAIVHGVLAAEPITLALVDVGTPLPIRAVLRAHGVPVIELPDDHGLSPWRNVLIPPLE